AGDVLDFDEKAPCLKAVKAISPKAWDALSGEWTDPWPEKTTEEILNDFRGSVDLPKKARS
ncbi:MAG: hypothetical protein SFY92_04190, partial [Verrucomicrobiae bacterium]|nr:hypothetical protein [Verrucomicrobiae bacterium]